MLLGHTSPPSLPPRPLCSRPSGQGWWGRGAGWHPRSGSSYPPDCETLCRAPASVGIHSGHKYPQLCPATCLFPKFPCHRFPSRGPSKSLTLQPDWPRPTNRCVTSRPALLLPGRGHGRVCCPRFCSPGGCPLPGPFRDVQRGAAVGQRLSSVPAAETHTEPSRGTIPGATGQPPAGRWIAPHSFRHGKGRAVPAGRDTLSGHRSAFYVRCVPPNDIVDSQDASSAIVVFRQQSLDPETRSTANEAWPWVHAHMVGLATAPANCGSCHDRTVAP